jgi:hypothetical protein
MLLLVCLYKITTGTESDQAFYLTGLHGSSITPGPRCPCVGKFKHAWIKKTLASMWKQRQGLKLKSLFVSDEWCESTLKNNEVGKACVVCCCVAFWQAVEDCMRTSQPLLILLRIVDGDERPAMAGMRAAMDHAKKSIKEAFVTQRAING